MRRLALLPLLVLVAGCGTVEREALVLAERAEPQQVELGWRESYGAGGRVLRFVVERFAVVDDGWTADVAIENATGIAFELGSRPLALAFGLMLFDDGRAETLEEANSGGGLPPPRRADTIEPPPPARLPTGTRWAATLSGRGALPAGSFVRVVFGTLVAVGKPPGDLLPTVVWITDRSTRLR